MQCLQKSILGQLDESALRVLSEKLVKEDYNKGHVLVKEGDEQTFAFVIESGEIGSYKKQEGSDEGLLLGKLEAGDASGFFHLYKQDPVFATLSVSSDHATIWKINSEDFSRLLKDEEAFFGSWLLFLNRFVRKQSKIIRSSKSSGSGSNKKLKIGFYDSSAWTLEAFDRKEFKEKFDFLFFKERLAQNTVKLAEGCDAISCFVNDNLDGDILRELNDMKIRMIALRCAGFDRVDLERAKAYNFTIARVPAYSPYAVAEHATTLFLALNRKIHRAYQRTRDGNFNLAGLVGFDMHGKTVGVIGTGKIGRCLIDIMLGFGCNIVCYDVYQCDELKQKKNVTYVELDELFAKADMISLHAPALDSTYHIINEKSIAKMKDGVVIVNTSRGSLVDNEALLQGLKSKKIASAGLDVYEGETAYFFEDHSGQIIADSQLRELLALPNVIVTGHQAFLTKEALNEIVKTTLNNVVQWKEGGKSQKDHPNSIY